MKKLLYSLLAISISLTACKYEEGPGISLRSKRDRISNEWLIKEYKYTPKDGSEQDLTNLYNNITANPDPLRSGAFGDSTFTYSYVMVMNRSGTYTMGIVDAEKKSVDPTKMWYYVDNNSNSFVDPLGIYSYANRGEWSFQTRHERLQLSPDNSGSNFVAEDVIAGRLAPMRFDIIMLANNQLKLQATDASGGVHKYDLTPLSTENYLRFRKD